MADFDSSLPIRTEGAGDVIVKIADATIPAQQLAVEADGSINVNGSFSLPPGSEIQITDGTDTLAVNADGSINVVSTATDLDIRDLSASQDNIAISDGADTLAVNADGSINITDNGGSITVDGTVTVTATDLDIRDIDFTTDSIDVSGSSVQVTATDLDIRDLNSTSDSVKVLQSVHDDLNANVNLQVGDVDVANGNPVPVSDAGGSLTVDATDLDIRDLAFATDKVDASGSTLGANSGVDIGDVTINNAAGASAVNIQDGGNSITVDASDLDIRDLTHASDSVKVGDGTDFLAVNTDGSINVVVVSEQDGTEVVDYQTSASVAANASVNHDYTVPGGVTFYGEEAWISASGKIKAQLLINAAVKWVGFNSSANPNIRIPLEHLAKASAAQVVRITITNNDNQAQDVYSTLLGVTKA